MKRRPNSSWPHLLTEEVPELDKDGVEEIDDPDPTVDFPQWSRSLLLLLDYAIIEGLQHNLHTFVEHLKRAEAELTRVASIEADSSDDERPPPQTH